MRFNISRVFLTPSHISSCNSILRRPSGACITLPLSNTVLRAYINIALDLRCKHTTGNIRATLLEAEDINPKAKWIVRVEAHRGREEIPVAIKRAPRREWWLGFSIVHRLRTSMMLEMSRVVCHPLLLYFYFILNPIPYLYLWISVKRYVRTATPRLAFRRAPFPLCEISLSLFFFSLSFRVPPLSLLSSTMSVQFWCDSLDFSREFSRDTWYFFFLVFRPFSSTIARFRVTMTRFYTSVRALCQRRYMCVRVFVHVCVRTRACVCVIV